MNVEINVPQIIEHKRQAPEGWEFCHGCLGYHHPDAMKTKKFCYFAYSVIHNDEMEGEDIPEIPFTDILPASISQARDIDEEGCNIESPTDDTSDVTITHENDNVTSDDEELTPETSPEIEKQRKTHVHLTDEMIEEIMTSSEPSRVIGDRLNISHMQVARVRKGQRVLI